MKYKNSITSIIPILISISCLYIFYIKVDDFTMKVDDFTTKLAGMAGSH